MEIRGRTILMLGGSGLVGLAVARRLLPLHPRALVLAALTRREAEEGVTDLRAEGGVPEGTELIAEWGDLFVPEALKDLGRGEIVAEPGHRALLLDDLYGELTDEVVRRSALGTLLFRHRPEILIDCVNTATAFAYQNVFRSAAALRAAAHAGRADVDAVEGHLATLYMPQLIRHVQIALEAMKQAGTGFYLKVGTAGTGGMGLNIPFTHSEERPSRMLLAKSGIAGAQTLLLYLMARTPGAPAVKEIKPTAAISWKRIGYGEIRRGGRPIPRVDATAALPLEAAFAPDAGGYAAAGGMLEGVFIDAGENGFFSIGEFEALTALGLMEFITPEEIAGNVVAEIQGHPTGKDVIAALDASTSGPTYRAGVLREVALDRMAALERQHGVSSVAYELLGPPRLSKLLFEAAILGRLYPDLTAAAALEPGDAATRAEELVTGDADLRVRILSIGLPILLPAGGEVLRGAEVRVGPAAGQQPGDPRLVDNGWVDLRAENWARWRDRIATICRELDALPGPEQGSRSDAEVGGRERRIRPGRLAAWIFRHEDRGERIKR
jgi:NAD(P)-dependent dehydrogenase (short-subunit alcohol dehydrogenase family)